MAIEALKIAEAKCESYKLGLIYDHGPDWPGQIGASDLGGLNDHHEEVVTATENLAMATDDLAEAKGRSEDLALASGWLEKLANRDDNDKSSKEEIPDEVSQFRDCCICTENCPFAGSALNWWGKCVECSQWICAICIGQWLEGSFKGKAKPCPLCMDTTNLGWRAFINKKGAFYWKKCPFIQGEQEEVVVPGGLVTPPTGVWLPNPPTTPVLPLEEEAPDSPSL